MSVPVASARARLVPLVAALVAAIAPAGVLGGCGGSSGNGVESKSPAEILAATKAAADGASSVHIAGSLSSNGSPITLDMYLVSGTGGRGQLSENGLSFELIVVDDSIYIKGSPAFYSHFGGSAAAQLFHGKWLKAPANSGELASLASLTDLSKLIDQALTNTSTLAKGATTTVAGQPAVELTDPAKDGSIYVATTGKPFPVQLVKRGAESGKVTFSGWNQPVSLAPPPNAIDLGALAKEAH
jgi:hypothetical protein